jgi:hypothetical protein
MQPLWMIIQQVSRIQTLLVIIKAPDTGKGMGVFDKCGSDDGEGAELAGGNS